MRDVVEVILLYFRVRAQVSGKYSDSYSQEDVGELLFLGP